MTGIKRLFTGMHIASSALRAERVRVDVIAKNIAHAGTTKMPDTGEPYRREVVRFEPDMTLDGNGNQTVRGLKAPQVEHDYTTPFEEVLDPGHPDANEEGIVRMPNVNAVREMADMITSLRAYEANLKVAENFERMAQRALRLAE